jgi:hypothetical protein
MIDDEEDDANATRALRETRENSALEKKKTEKAKREAERLSGSELARRLIPAASNVNQG